MRIARFEEQPSKRSKQNGDKSAVAMLKRNEQHQRTGETIGLRISGYGAAEVFIDFAEELKHTENNPMCKNSQMPSCVTLTFETKNHRLEWFAQVNLVSVGPTLQNLRIVHKKRQNGKSKVPAKQRGKLAKSVF